MRPVAKKWCRYAELKYGPYTIDDLADMNEAIDELDEYERRHEAAAKEKK